MVPDTSLPNSLGIFTLFVLVKENLKWDLTSCERNTKILNFWGNKSPLSLEEKNKYPVLRKKTLSAINFFSQRKHVHRGCAPGGPVHPQAFMGTMAPFPCYWHFTSLLTFWNQEPCVSYMNCPPTSLPSTTIHNILQDLLQSLPSCRNSWTHLTQSRLITALLGGFLRALRELIFAFFPVPGFYDFVSGISW